MSHAATSPLEPSPLRKSTRVRGIVMLLLLIGLAAAPAGLFAQDPVENPAPNQAENNAENPVATAGKTEDSSVESEAAPRSDDSGQGSSAADGASETDEPVATQSRRPFLPLPPSLPDGRPLRPIALYLSQMDELIPDDYRPVSIEQLNEAITRSTDRATDDKASRLKSAVYWVKIDGGRLISDRSVIDIESDRPTEVRRSLGQVNLAIEPPQSRGVDEAIDALPRLESELDGDLVAVFRGDQAVSSRIEFRWRLNGTRVGTGYEFTMQMPRTAQTRIVLSAPADLAIEALDGVLRSRPGPPPDADEFITDGEWRWYEIDAGGLSQVRLRAQRQRLEADRGSFIIRRSSVQYEAQSGGLSWNSRMVVQIPSDHALPSLEVRGTTVTSIKVNATEVPFSTKSLGPQRQQLQLEMPIGLGDSGTAEVNVSVAGYSTWSDEPGWCELPKPMWVGDDIIHASCVDEVQLRVYDPLQVIAWDLPSDWKQTQTQRIESGFTFFAADGPPAVAANANNATDQPKNERGNRQNATVAGGNAATASTEESWSRVRLADRPDILAAGTKLRIEVGPELLTATARVSVEIDPKKAEPLRLLVQPRWSIESVTFSHSGRVVDQAVLNERRQSLDLWPEVEDAKDGRVDIEIAGTRGIPSNAGEQMIPSTWFVRVDQVREGMVAAIVPPTEKNWSGEAAMKPGRIREPRLTADQQEFFGPLSPETLWFQPETGRTPGVLLQTPSVSYNAASVLELRLEEGEIVEELSISVESQSQSLKRLEVHAGRSSDRPNFTWSIGGNASTSAINLASTDVTVIRGDDDVVYSIDVSETNLRDRTLVGRRRYAAESEMEIQLPSVPGSASSDSEVLVSADLAVKQRPKAVQLVPLSSRQQSNAAYEGLAAPVAFESSNDVILGQGWSRLRYDAVDQLSIRVAKVESNPDLSIVWRERVRVIASSRGTDRIEASYRVSPAAPLRIEHDPELQLISVHRDGVPVDLITLQQRPIVLQPRSKTEDIRIVWDRSQFGSSWVRRCRIPHVRISGTVLRSEYQLLSASDSFAPAALLMSRSNQGRSIEVRPGDAAVLLRRNTALAIGWLSAILVFALGWVIAQRSPTAVAAALLLATAVLFLWWPWRMAIIGWLIVPLVAAAMLSTSRARMRASDRAKNGGSKPENRGSSSGQDLSSDFSMHASPTPIIFWALVIAGAGAMATAQDSVRTAKTPPAVNVLVPVLKTGQMSGDMVYIPKAEFEELFRTGGASTTQDARFQSADYRVRIDPSNVSSEQLIFSGVEAEYQIHIADGDNNTNLVRLPIAATSLRRLETIDDVSRILPFEPDSMGQVVAALPKGDAFKIRATFRPMVSSSEPWVRLYLPVPQVASARLTVESEQNVDAIRVGGATGRLLAEEESLLRRWVDEIGPTRNLEIDVRVDRGLGAGVSPALGRRYWIHAGKRQVTIDCEVDPAQTIAAGETFQFVVRDSAIPTVVSSAWQYKGSELYSPTRRLITLESMRDSPGPIQLLWTQPLSLQDDGESQSAEIRIPEVIAAALGENANAWIALHCDSAMQFLPPARESVEPLSVDQFLASWMGYRGRIEQRAFVAIGELPVPVVQIKPTTQVQIDQAHHLHVMPGFAEIQYTATLTPSDLMRRLFQLQVPPAIELVSVSVNGAAISNRQLISGGTGELFLGEFVGAEPVEIKVVATQDLPADRSFTPPRLSIVPHALVTDEYRISRDPATRLRTVKRSPVPPTSEGGPAMADSLAEGSIPVSSWSSRWDSEGEAATPGGIYQVKPQPTRFDCDQLIVLDRQGAGWSMETFVRFTKRVPEFLDIEVPAAWCEELEVRPATALSRQQAIDPSRQVIRVRCDEDSIADGTLSIRGSLSTDEIGRVSVPTVRVLGVGRRRIHISVPNRLDDEAIQWRPSAVESDELPEAWQERVTSRGRSSYVVANPSWSIDLGPLPEVDAVAVALCADAQTFPQDDGALVMCHWDLFPGSLEAVEVRLPPGTSALGAWSAGQPVLATKTGVDESPDSKSAVPQDADADEHILRIPLALSRLSQPLELLVRVPSSATKRADYLPELIGIPVRDRWLTNYVEADATALSWGEVTQPGDDRAIALATAAVDAMDSVASISQRPRDEVETWLRLWFTRYRMIAEAAGHQPFFEQPAEEDVEEGTILPIRGANNATERLSLPTYLQWEELDSRMADYAVRFMSDPEIRAMQNDDDVFLFGIANFDGFIPGRVSHLTKENSARAIQPARRGDQGLRSLVVSVLTLVLVGGLLICLRPLQQIVHPYVSHPAFWLCVLGVFCFAVAPIPVAASLILVAVALAARPLRNNRSPRSA